jgi:hypothetical protein
MARRQAFKNRVMGYLEWRWRMTYCEELCKKKRRAGRQAGRGLQLTHTATLHCELAPEALTACCTQLVPVWPGCDMQLMHALTSARVANWVHAPHPVQDQEEGSE